MWKCAHSADSANNFEGVDTYIFTFKKYYSRLKSACLFLIFIQNVGIYRLPWIIENILGFNVDCWLIIVERFLAIAERFSRFLYVFVINCSMIIAHNDHVYVKS